MRVLVIGGGGREHALCWKIARSPLCERLYCAPGNAGIAQLAQILPLPGGDADAVIDACRAESIDLVVVGPEQPLVDGLADRLRAVGIATFGPSAAAAQMEGSKAFAKDFMQRHGVPTAGHRVFDDPAQLTQWLENCPLPTVVKADGLAAGKGVLICTTRAEAREAAEVMGGGGRFGAAAEQVVVEEFMEGEEASVFALVDGETVLPLQPLQDHKRRFDGDEGPNTGGMGAYTPVPAMDDELQARVMEEVLLPVAQGLVADGTPYSGLLYAGLMLTETGPRVVEFNCRFGDPETQPLVLAMESDLLPLLAATAGGTLDQQADPVFHRGSTLCVVLVSGGYPGPYPKGLVVRGLDDPYQDDAVVFHAGTATDESGNVVTSGGRVLGVTARGASVSEARRKAYELVDRIGWDGADCRRDIGFRALPEKGGVL